MEETIRELIEICTKNHFTISSCESLTAGLFTSQIASVPGASAILKGGLVTYFTPMKTRLAHVDEKLIETYGVVSSECAFAMAKNTREIMEVDFCVSFTGNAGPSSMEGKPAGLVYCAIASKNDVEVYDFLIHDHSRNEVREMVVSKMLERLLQRIKKEIVWQKQQK